MATVFNLAYGSNLHRARISARVEILAVVGTVRLPGWGLRFHKQGADDSGKCNLIRAPQEIAYGVVYEFSANDKTTLDTIEGVGNGYRDERLSLDSRHFLDNDKIGTVEVSAYIAVPSHIDDSLIPYDWYHAFVRHGARQCDFPAEYLAHIDMFRHKPDRDITRRAENLNLLDY